MLADRVLPLLVDVCPRLSEVSRRSAGLLTPGVLMSRITSNPACAAPRVLGRQVTGEPVRVMLVDVQGVEPRCPWGLQIYSLLQSPMLLNILKKAACPFNRISEKMDSGRLLEGHPLRG